MQLNATEIQEYLENRFPFLMIDRIVDGEPGKFMVAKKNISINEWFFQGHFPGNPIMPGVLQLEAMFNTAALAIMTLPKMKGKNIVMARAASFMLHKYALPGDSLEIRADLKNYKRGVGNAFVKISCEGVLISDADITLAVPKEVVLCQ